MIRLQFEEFKKKSTKNNGLTIYYNLVNLIKSIMLFVNQNYI